MIDINKIKEEIIDIKRNIKDRKKLSIAMKDIVSKEVLYQEYIAKNKSIREVGKDLGINYHFIMARLKYFKLTRSKSESMKGIHSSQWKGDNVGLQAIHVWVRFRKPKLELCENCKKSKPYDLANISQEYHRDTNDFKWLCRKCHMEEDGRKEELKRISQSKSRENKEGLLYCSKCSKFKKKEDFFNSNFRKDKHSDYCKVCEKIRTKEYKLRKITKEEDVYYKKVKIEG